MGLNDRPSKKLNYEFSAKLVFKDIMGEAVKVMYMKLEFVLPIKFGLTV